MNDKNQDPKATEQTPDEKAEQGHRFPKLDLHKLPGAESLAEVVEAQLTHLKVLLEGWERFEADQKERILKGIDDLARWAHHAVDFGADLTARARKTSIGWIEQGTEKLRPHN
jgi:hypothetical protein